MKTYEPLEEYNRKLAIIGALFCGCNFIEFYGYPYNFSVFLSNYVRDLSMNQESFRPYRFFRRDSYPDYEFKWVNRI
jgi:hypothetical protein